MSVSRFQQLLLVVSMILTPSLASAESYENAVAAGRHDEARAISEAQRIGALAKAQSVQKSILQKYQQLEKSFAGKKTEAPAAIDVKKSGKRSRSGRGRAAPLDIKPGGAESVNFGN